MFPAYFSLDDYYKVIFNQTHPDRASVCYGAVKNLGCIGEIVVSDGRYSISRYRIAHGKYRLMEVANDHETAQEAATELYYLTRKRKDEGVKN